MSKVNPLDDTDIFLKLDLFVPLVKPCLNKGTKLVLYTLIGKFQLLQGKELIRYGER